MAEPDATAPARFGHGEVPSTARALARAILDEGLSPDAGVRAADAAIRARNPGLNAIVDYDPHAASGQIQILADRLKRGERPPLAGVPVVVKDHIRVRGWKATSGSRLFADTVAEEDDLAVARLRSAGAILVGRSNMSEFGCKGVTTNLLYGPTRHPMNPDLTTGGSSGGAAAALAGGLVPLALGSDGGGSARRPAAHAGVVGFKPSSGVVAEPRALSATGVLGPMALNVADVSLFFDAIRGSDPRDPFSLDLSATIHADRPPVIAFSPRLGLDVPVDTDVEVATAAAIDAIRASGIEIGNADPKWPDGAGEPAVMALQHAGLAATYGDAFRRDPNQFDPDIAAQITDGLALPATAVAAAAAMSTAIAGAAARFFAGGVDILLTPTTPCVAWPHAQLGPATIGGIAVPHRGHAVFTPLFNHAFCAAISIPAGRGRDGLPIGLQIVGPRFSDFVVLALAARLEAILDAAGLWSASA